MLRQATTFSFTVGQNSFQFRYIAEGHRADAGHATQITNKNLSEEDGWDERSSKPNFSLCLEPDHWQPVGILPSDGDDRKIMDNVSESDE